MSKKEVIAEYRKLKPTYEKISEIVEEKLDRLIKDNNIFIMGVMHRVKSEESLEGKIERKPSRAVSLSRITDILGFRIITYFTDDVDFLGDLLRQEFVIDENNSVDKRKALTVNQFGYMALHFVCSLKPEEGIPEEYAQLKFEIQLKTVLQHAWAEIEHDLGYKSEFGIPDVIKRRFSIVAGLLELGDKEFVGLRDSSRQYLTDTQERIRNDEADEITVDFVSVREYLRHNQKMLDLYKRIHDECNVEVINTDTSSIVEPMKIMGIRNLGMLSDLRERTEEAVIAKIKETLTANDLDIATDRSILRMMISEELMRTNLSEELMGAITDDNM